MGFKSLLLIVSIAFFAIFAIQNRGAIVLTFFGFNSPALPLFLWVLLALLAGIISSLLINLLTSNPVNNNQRNQSVNANIPYSPPPQSPPRQQKSPPVEKSHQERETATENLNYRWEEDEVFEDLPDNPVNTVAQNNFMTDRMPVSPTILEKNLLNETTESTQIPSTPNQEIEDEEIAEIPLTPNQEIEDEEIPDEEIKIKDEEIPDEEIKIEDIQDIEDKEELTTFAQEIATPEREDYPPNLLKTREASPYSYQTREKTEIRPKNTKSKAKQNPSPPTPKRLYQGVYDAPYRVIAPAQDYNSDYELDRDDDFEENDEDWDF